MARERTFVLLKPDALQRALVGAVLQRFERRGLKLVAMKLLTVPRSTAQEYYAEHRGKAFFDGLIRYVTSGPVVAMVLEGKDSVAVVRSMMGATNPAAAAPGTIRADLGIDIGRNLIHGSDSTKSAEREIGIFFRPEELHSYERIDEKWLYE